MANKDYEKKVAKRYADVLEMGDGEHGYDCAIRNLESLYPIEIKTTRNMARNFALGRGLKLTDIMKYTEGGMLLSDEIDILDYFSPRKLSEFLMTKIIDPIFSNMGFIEKPEVRNAFKVFDEKPKIRKRIIDEMEVAEYRVINVSLVREYCPIIVDSSHLKELAQYDANNKFSLEKSLKLGYTEKAHKILKEMV